MSPLPVEAGSTAVRYKKAGRPTKKTELNRQIILIELAKCPVLENACDCAGVSYETLRIWLNEDPNFKAQVKAIIGTEVMSLYTSVKDRDPWKLLKNVGRRHFKENPDEQIVQQFTWKIGRTDEDDDSDGETFPGY